MATLTYAQMINTINKSEQITAQNLEREASTYKNCNVAIFNNITSDNLSHLISLAKAVQKDYSKSEQIMNEMILFGLAQDDYQAYTILSTCIDYVIADLHLKALKSLDDEEKGIARKQNISITSHDVLSHDLSFKLSDKILVRKVTNISIDQFGEQWGNVKIKNKVLTVVKRDDYWIIG